MNAILHGRDGTSGVDLDQAWKIGQALLFSPLVGFTCAALLLLLMKLIVRKPELYEAPTGNGKPPLWIRILLIFTCTGVSFAHGSNDGQKGMGLIMLILIGTVPTAYALNHALPNSYTGEFAKASAAVSQVVEAKAAGYNIIGDPRPVVTAYISRHEITGGTFPALSLLIKDISRQITTFGSINKVPYDQVGNTRNDIYLTSEALRLLTKDKAAELSAADVKVLNSYKSVVDQSTKFIPGWVKVCVAIALGLGTMVGWKRIVVTVGEKIGKTHLTYGQGGAAELVAMGTIAAADMYGLPVSTTHVLSSGVAGTMAANGSGLQLATLRNIALAWVLTLPAAMAISAGLYWVFSRVVG
jgi:PiT family inorganic phosphate transporter